MLTILDASTLAAVQAAATQDAQAAALVAPWAGGNVTARVMNGDTLLATLTQGPWVQDNGADPREAVLGARLARTFVATGTPTRVVFRAGSTDIFSLSAGVGSGDVSFAAAISANSLERIAGITVTAATALPKVTYATAFTIALAASSGATNSPVSGTVTPTGGPLSAAATVTLACGSGTFADATLDFASGATAAQAFSFTPTSDATHSVSMTNTLGLTNTGSPASYTSTTSGGLTVGAQVATLTITSESGSGSRPFAAAVLPLEGDVPSGSYLSNAAGTEVGDILSTHSDGSAAVVVFASTASATGTMALHVATGTAPAALTAAAIAAAGVTSVAVDLGSYGIASITDFSTPESVWWATSKVYCARYRVAAPTPGTTALEAVIDIHAWSDRALVEVVVENAKINTSLSTVLAAAAAGYTGATVGINGGTVATVSSSGVPVEAAHSWSRAWYASGWVGAGATGLRVHQAVAELQQHPLLFEMDQASTADLSGYSADTYTVWDYGRKPDANMGGVGDVDAIGPLSKWQAQWLQSGSVAAANAVEVQGLLTLHWNINTRDVTTGRVPTHTQINLKSINGNGTWPNQTNGSTALCWELMHHPAEGLAAFLVRPSPVFIEIAQKIAVWNAMWPTNFENSTVQPTGVFRGGGCTTRGRAWALRSLAHAIFLTPDGDAWKTPAKTSLAANIAYLDGYRTSSDAKLNICWEGDPALPQDVPYGSTVADGPVFSTRGWFSHYLITEVHKLASARLLTGADQTAADTLADWLAQFPVRWVNEQPNGGWRYIPYSTALGRNATTIDSPATWAEMRAYTHSDIPAALTGTWYFGTGDPINYSAGYGNSDTNRPRYVDYFWAALVAAVERGVAGSRAAWSRVNRDVTNLTTWRAGFGTEPRWGSAPRAVAESYGVLDSSTSAIAAGAWLDISSSTNVGPVTDTGPEGAATIPWLSGSGVSTGYRPLLSWGGNMTFDPVALEIVAVGATNGYGSESPAGNHTAELVFDVAAGTFSKTWQPFASNTAHQYDANSTTDSPNGRLRRSFDNAGLYRKAAGTWSYVDHTGSGNMGINSAQSPSGEFHPRLGRMGSFVVAGNAGILGRFDEYTAVQSQIAASSSGVGGPEVIAAYHPAIDKVIFGGGSGGTTLYTVDSAGTVASFTSTFPAGVSEIGPRDVINAVLAPDPQGRAYAWLFDKSVTGKVWRLNLTTQAWTDMGAMPAGFLGTYCVATVPPVGIHVLMASGVDVTAGVNNGKVWAYRPA